MNMAYSKQKENKNVSNPWTIYNESHYVKAIHLSYSLDKAPPKFNFVCWHEPIWLAHDLKNMNLWRLLKLEGIILKYIVSHFGPWPSYKDERRTRFAKTYGIKMRHTIKIK